METLDDILDKVAIDNKVSPALLKKILDIERAHLYLTQVKRNNALNLIRTEIIEGSKKHVAP